MKEIKADFAGLELSIEQLRGLALSGFNSSFAVEEFQGDFSVVKTFQELYALVEETELLWYNAAQYEATVLESTRENFRALDNGLSKHIGGPLTGGVNG